MSIETAVILSRSRLPTPAAWQEALTAAGFPVSIDTDFDPLTFEGFLPATYAGRPGGFEYFFAELDASAYDPAELARFGDRDVVVSMMTHSDFTELMTAVLSAAALAHLTGGVVHDTEAGEFHEADAAVAWGREGETALLPELE